MCVCVHISLSYVRNLFIQFMYFSRASFVDEISACTLNNCNLSTFEMFLSRKYQALMKINNIRLTEQNRIEQCRTVQNIVENFLIFFDEVWMIATSCIDSVFYIQIFYILTIHTACYIFKLLILPSSYRFYFPQTYSSYTICCSLCNFPAFFGFMYNKNSPFYKLCLYVKKVTYTKC